MDYQHLTFERDGHVAVVTFNRPDKANGLNRQLMLEIEQVANDLRADAATRVVIFTGAGKHFCAGVDLEGRAPEPETLLMQRRERRVGERMLRALMEIDQVTIAAWNGAAIGGGACIAAVLDFRIGSETCFMSYPEVNLGLNLIWKALPHCVRLMGPSRAKRMLMGGAQVGAEDLETWGVLDARCPPEALMETAHSWAAHYAAQPPLAVQMIKRSINAVTHGADQAVMHMDADQYMLARGTEDAGRAALALREKRKATFSGN